MGVSLTEFAARVGVNEAVVRKALQSGRITAERDGTINPETALKDWEANRDSTKDRPENGPGRPPGTKPSQDVQNFAKLRTAKESIRVRRERLQLGQEEGRLIETDAVRKMVTEFARVHRDAALNFASRYGSEIAARIGAAPALVIGVLDEYMRVHLQEVASIELPARLQALELAEGNEGNAG